MADDDTEKETMGWAVDARLTRAIRRIAKRESRLINGTTERVLIAGLVALGEGDPTVDAALPPEAA